MDYKAFYKLSYGLYIVASVFDGKKAGYIANTAFQVTSQPPLVAVSCHKKNATTPVIEKSGIFSVSVLKKEADVSIIGQFGFMSGDDIDKFRNVKFETFSTGAPVVTEPSVAWFECKVTNSIDVGSHILFLGEVVGSGILSDGEPLTYRYYREKYKMLAPPNAPTYIEKEKLETEAPPRQESADIIRNEDSGGSYICTICGFTYDPEVGDPTAGVGPGTPFGDIPDNYKCPVCNAGKDYFKPV